MDAMLRWHDRIRDSSNRAQSHISAALSATWSNSGSGAVGTSGSYGMQHCLKRGRIAPPTLTERRLHTDKRHAPMARHVRDNSNRAHTPSSAALKKWSNGTTGAVGTTASYRRTICREGTLSSWSIRCNTISYFSSTVTMMVKKDHRRCRDVGFISTDDMPRGDAIFVINHMEHNLIFQQRCCHVGEKGPPAL